MNDIYETIKEYKTFVETLDFEVKGRVLKRLKPTGERDYRWEVSHYCKPSEGAATPYIPSTSDYNTFREAEMWLLSYMQPFTGIDVMQNKFY